MVVVCVCWFFGGDRHQFNTIRSVLGRLTVRKEGPNQGKVFYNCTTECNFFQWADAAPSSHGNSSYRAAGGAPSRPPSNAGMYNQSPHRACRDSDATVAIRFECRRWRAPETEMLRLPPGGPHEKQMSASAAVRVLSAALRNCRTHVYRLLLSYLQRYCYLVIEINHCSVMPKLPSASSTAHRTN